MSTNGQVAIVTGASQGIGFAISSALLTKGYKVCLSDINDEKGQESLEDLQKLFGVDRVMYTSCDVTIEQQYHELFSKVLKEFGRVDVLVNNAGIANELDPALMIKINLMGPINGCQTALKYMSKRNGGYGGVVINMASILGLLSYFKLPVYTATKHGVVGLTRSYGCEYYLESTGIEFMAICPYYVRTPLLKAAKSHVAERGIDVEKIPDIIEPEFVAEGVLKLLEDKQNGSIMAVIPGKYQYIGRPEELKDIKM